MSNTILNALCQKNGFLKLPVDKINGTVFCVVAHGFAIRYFLRSKTFQILKDRNLKLVIVSPQWDQPEFCREFEDKNVSFAPLRLDLYKDYHKKKPTLQYIKYLCAYTFNAKFPNDTITDFYRIHRNQSRRIWMRLFYDINQGVLFFLRRSLWLRSLLVKIAIKYYTPNYHQDIFTKYKPDMVVVASIGFITNDDCFMREAGAHGVTVTSLIISWDHLSNKGMGLARAEHVIVWSENMKREVVEYHDYDPGQIWICGNPLFDIYVQKPSQEDWSQFCRRHQLDPLRKTIVFICKSPSSFPWNPEIIEILASAIRDNKFMAPCQMIARIHPIHYIKKHIIPGSEMSVQGSNEIEYQRIKRQYDHVVFNQPLVHGLDKNCFDIDNSETRILSMLLTQADVVVNMFSTINIEGSMVDVPLVNVCFNGDGGKSLFKNPRHNLYFDERQVHNQRVVQSGAITMVRNPEELISAINIYLKDRTVLREQRRELVIGECGPFSGQAALHIANQIVALLKVSY